MTGPTSAQTTVVMARSYSRISGHTSLDATTNTSGSAAWHAAATRCSWVGLAYECRKHTATPAGAARPSRSVRSRTESSPSGTRTSPRAPTRSVTSKVRAGGTGGGGGV